MARPTCGEATLDLLEGYGVDVVFGIPGVHTIELYRNLSGRKARHVLTRHEQGAGFMADGYARVTGRPAACVLISGPGLTNAATPIAQAYADSQPMVVIASTNTRREIGKGWGPFHELRNQRLIAEQICGFAGQALAPDDVPEVMAQAFAALGSGRPRPVYIEIPRDVLAEPATGDWTVKAVAEPPAPRPERIREAAEVLAAATRPLVLLGAGAAEAGAALREIVEITGAAVISSFCGKGIIPESHRNVLGAALAMAEARALVADADAVLAVGTELSTADAANQTLSFTGKLLRVDIDPRKMSDRYPAGVAILGDAALTAEALLDALSARPVEGAAPAWRRQLARVKALFQRWGGPRFGQHRKVLEVLRRTLPADAVVIGDMTQLAYTGNHFFRTERPRAWLHPASYATLGFALPAAIGAKIARPQRPVVSIAGDCGFLFTCQEMATAAERKLPIVQILWNNEALGEIRDAMIGAQIEPVEVGGLTPDFLSLARSFHWHAARAVSLDDLEAQVEKALGAEGPSLIELREGEGDWAA